MRLVKGFRILGRHSRYENGSEAPGVVVGSASVQDVTGLSYNMKMAFLRSAMISQMSDNQAIAQLSELQWSPNADLHLQNRSDGQNLMTHP